MTMQSEIDVGFVYGAGSVVAGGWGRCVHLRLFSVGTPVALIIRSIAPV